MHDIQIQEIKPLTPVRRSLIDLNRAGIPLMEIVFEPDLKDGEEAGALVKELTLILQRLDTCNCKMEGITYIQCFEGFFHNGQNIIICTSHLFPRGFHASGRQHFREPEWRGTGDED